MASVDSSGAASRATTGSALPVAIRARQASTAVVAIVGMQDRPQLEMGLALVLAGDRCANWGWCR